MTSNMKNDPLCKLKVSGSAIRLATDCSTGPGTMESAKALRVPDTYHALHLYVKSCSYQIHGSVLT